MDIDPGLAVVIGAVLIFYLRLIIIQRERAKRLRQAPAAPASSGGAGSGRRSPGKEKGSRTRGAGAGNKAPAQKDRSSAVSLEQYSILSPRRSDRVIAGVGALLLLLGVGLYAGVLPLETLQPYWWAPAAAGIVAFSWAFRL